MHDPMTVAFEVRYPWRAYRGPQKSEFLSTYRSSFLTIWHVDPERDGTDDSCGWFPRARHGDKAVFERIIKRFEWDWDRTFKSDGTGKVYNCGLFAPTGAPHLSVIGITLNLFFVAAIEVFGSRDKAARFMRRNLFEILWFAENPVDSAHDGITLKFGNDYSRDDRIRQHASMVYGWILREQRPWWQHPKWHVWHWSIQVHPWQVVRRWLFSRCAACGKRFPWGYSPVSHQWDREKPKFLRGEVGLYHSECSTLVNAKPQGTA